VSVNDAIIERTDAGFVQKLVPVAVARNVKVARGVVRSSLFQAADDAQIPESVTVQLAEVFGSEIDFLSDLRKGDEFQLAYEMLSVQGEPLRAGRLIAAQFTNRGKRYEALWYEVPGSAGSYYSFNGQSLRRSFLRAPLEFSRVSSGFGGRMHPIARQWREHRGVDYAAPTGTPVRATSDGVVSFAGRQGGYGNVIELEHRGDVSTLYGHLNGFAATVRKGTRVNQGDVIGYVGSTGWSTGPHLHYEFRVKGVYKDPLTVALPEAAPIDVREASRFAISAAANAQRLQLAQGMSGSQQQ
jgi:murein DD-endopeptidase MepM/ murein hydrolase activator NlpD